MNLPRERGGTIKNELETRLEREEGWSIASFFLCVVFAWLCWFSVGFRGWWGCKCACDGGGAGRGWFCCGELD